jgi:hypothetical protein
MNVAGQCGMHNGCTENKREQCLRVLARLASTIYPDTIELRLGVQIMCP